MTNLSNLVEILAKQALGGQNPQQNQQNNAGGLGGILGSVLGQVLNQQMQQRPQQQSQNSGLGGILGSVLGQLAGGQSNSRSSVGGGSGKSALLIAVLPIVLAWIQKQGGIQGALDKLKNSGLSSQVNSWVSPEHNVQNEEVQPEQVQTLFDDDEIEQISAQTAEPKQNIYSAIASALPQIIDSLTPDGDKTDQKEADTDIQDISQSISSVLKR